MTLMSFRRTFESVRRDWRLALNSQHLVASLSGVIFMVEALLVGQHGVSRNQT